MVEPKGDCAARSGSTWIHWWSPVASAKASISLLGDLVPVADAELLADLGLEFVDAGDGEHGREI